MDQAAARHYGSLFLTSILGLAAGGTLMYFAFRPQGIPIEISTPGPTATALPTPTRGPMRIYVSGAVRAAAVYELSPGSLVADAIQAAGGATSDAALENINLALELQDQQHIHIPKAGEAPPPPPASGSVPVDAGAPAGPININTATATELERLPRIGPALAGRIIAYREANGPFQRVEDIQNVDGIGPSTLEQLRELITVHQE